MSRSREYEVGGSLSSGSRLMRGAGELLRIPTIDIAEVGAGGGSIAWLDPAGGLQVGPRSAGAAPGPACYGRGGDDATVTDANVHLGYIPTGALASGDLSVSSELAERALEGIAGPLELSLPETAAGVHAIANARMTRALRSVSSEKGRDPREFTLIAYGGSGPVHALGLAEDLGCRTVLVPALAGLFSSLGLLFARPEFHDVYSCHLDARTVDPAEISRVFDELEARLAPSLAGASAEWIRSVDLRYGGQSWEVEVELTGSLDDLLARFEDEHERLYGVRGEAGSPIEIRALRLAGLGPSAAVEGLGLADERDGAGGTRPGSTASSTTCRCARARRSAKRREAGAAADRRVRHDRRRAARLDCPARPRHRDARTGARDEHGDAARSGHAADRRQRARVDRRRDGDDDLPHRALDRRPGRDGLLGGDLRSERRDRRAGGDGAVPSRLGAARDEDAAREVGRRDAAGDVFVMNDPFDGGIHLQDIFVFKPVFYEERLIGFATTTAHHGDVGGRLPGSSACDNTEIFQEGIRLPWLRLYDRGEPVEVIFQIIRANVRIPRMTLGDLGAQVAATSVAERALQELAVRYGPDRLAELMTGLIEYTERLVRQEIAGWPDGTATFTDYLDSDGIERRDVRITATVTIAGDEITADLTDCAPMVRGSLNSTRSFIQACVYQAVRCALTVEIPNTSGAFRPIHVLTKPGTIAEVVMPGASSMRGVTGFRVLDAVNGALAQLVPGRVGAAGEGGNTLAIFGSDRPDGSGRFIFYELIVGTWGGTPENDGNDGLTNPASLAANIPVEVAEAEFPILVERYGLVPDSGGAGKHRGGLAVERVWKCLTPGHVPDRQVRPLRAPALRPAGRRTGRALVERARPPGRQRGGAAVDVLDDDPGRRRLRAPHRGRRRLGRPAGA